MVKYVNKIVPKASTVFFINLTRQRFMRILLNLIRIGGHNNSINSIKYLCVFVLYIVFHSYLIFYFIMIHISKKFLSGII